MSCFCSFNATATTELYTLSLHDALPISMTQARPSGLGHSKVMEVPVSDSSPTMPSSGKRRRRPETMCRCVARSASVTRSEEHTSELQSQFHLVCRLLLEKK